METVVTCNRDSTLTNHSIDEKRGLVSDRRHRLYGIAAIAAVALMLAACSTAPQATSTSTGAGTPPGAAAPAAADVLRGSYAALGDSYAAGPAFPTKRARLPGASIKHSYPFLVAQRLRLELTDMSCSSATIADLSAAQPTGHGINPAQLSALSSATALVTLGIGGNDVAWASIVTRWTELDLIPVTDPGRKHVGSHAVRGLLLARRHGPDPAADPDGFRAAGQNSQPDQVACPACPRLRCRLPRPAALLGQRVREHARHDNWRHRLPQQRGTAAQWRVAASSPGRGDGYVDTYGPSEGHDACAAPASRWIEPLIPDAAAAPLHPNAVGEQGMADAIVAAVKAD